MSVKTYIYFFICCIFFLQNISAQTPQWRTLTTAPVAEGVKHDDCFFINSSTGWLVTGLEIPGKVFKTTDGGIVWSEQFSDNSAFRSIGFANAMTGWIGTLTPSKVIFHTTNGGVNWQHDTLPFPQPQGICGISVVNSSYVFGCGIYRGPAHFIKTTNGGFNWITVNMSPAATSLVDCYFTSPDSGFVVGGIGLPHQQNSKPVVLFTSNGGNTWVNRYTGILNKEWCWKISFLNANTGFIAVESYRYVDTIAFLKTTNKGVNWIEHRIKIDTNIYHAEGIGFITPMTGWIGGYNWSGTGLATPGKTYETTDGGINWYPVTWGYSVNRFRILSDTLAYAVGKTVYKFTSDSTIGIDPNQTTLPKDFILYQNYPNPFNPATKITYLLKEKSSVKITIYDLKGKEVFYYTADSKPAGNYEFEWYGTDMQTWGVSSGVYFYKLETEKYSESKKMVLVR